jgi:hypothetical protein
MRGDGGNHHEKLGLERISCESQLTIADTAGTTADPAGTNTDTMSSKPNQACPNPDFSYPLVSSVLFPYSFRISLSLSSSQNTKSSHPSVSIHSMIMI